MTGQANNRARSQSEREPQTSMSATAQHDDQATAHPHSQIAPFSASCDIKFEEGRTTSANLMSDRADFGVVGHQVRGGEAGVGHDFRRKSASSSPRKSFTSSRSDS